MTVRRRCAVVAVLTTVWLCVSGKQRILRSINGQIMSLHSEGAHKFLALQMTQPNEQPRRRLWQLPATDVPPFFMRVKIAESFYIRDDQLEKELEHVMAMHLAPLFQEHDGGTAVPTLHAILTRERRPDGHEILEVAFTGSIRYKDNDRQYSPDDILAVLRRGLLTRKEYTRLVDSMHNSEGLPMVRGVVVSLVPFPEERISEPHSPEKIKVPSSVDAAATLADDGYGEMRLVALMSMGALLSIVLFAIDFLIRPKRKNWKVKKRRLSDEPSRVSKVYAALSWGSWFRRRQPVSTRPPGWRRSPLRGDSRDGAQRRRSRSGDVTVHGRSPLGDAVTPSARPPPARSSSYDKLEAMVLQRNAALARRAQPIVGRSNSLEASGDGGNKHRSMHLQLGPSAMPPASPPRRGRRRASLELASGADGVM